VNQRDFVLAAFAGVKQSPLTPVQAQKLIFLADRNVGPAVGGSGFNFRPYSYGPFDRDVYLVLQSLRNEGLAAVEEGSPRTYRLTPEGQAAGEQIAAGALAKQYVDYIATAGTFVRSQSFAGLVSSIYKAYPEMKANSVFRE
jgi:uncharacterized protein